jgi:Carboxypeptidase regulatory-like domain
MPVQPTGVQGMTRRRRNALTTALLLCLSIVPLAGAQGPETLPAWGTEPSPNAGFPHNELEAVDAFSPTDAWAVGHYNFNNPRPVIAHWDGTDWSSVTPGWPEESELFGVEAVAPSDVWMVGGYQSGGHALIAHWDGSALTTLPHPNPGAFNRLYAVTAIAADDVWAVGEYTDPISKTLALHWDGTSWTHVPTPTGDGYSHLYGVSAVATDDVFAVGNNGNNAFSLHWNGSEWSSLPTPSRGFSTVLRDVSAAADGDVWAVGDSGDDSVTLRWTGSTWTDVPAPDPGPQFLDLDGVTVISATNAWAVGVYDVSGGSWRTLTMHWDGTDWSVVDSPSPDPQINRLYGVTALPQGEVWAVGYGGGTGTLALRRAGESWVQTVTVNEGTGDNVLNAISVHSSQDIWAVGHAQQRSLTLHYDGSAWTVVPSPNRQYGLRLEDVVAIANDDVWAVGWTGSNSFDDESIALHWDGASWTIVPTPQPGNGINRLFAIDAAGPNDIWATGTFGDIQGSYFSSILHWDGTSWSLVADDCDTYGGLTGVTVVSSTEAWAVGDATTCHFDGKRWMEVPSPQPRPEHYEIAYPLEDVAAAAPDDVWAVGARITDNGWYIAWQSLAEHWDGSQWTLTTFVPGTLMRGVEALSATDVWAVGTDSFGPLIVHYDGAEWSRVPTPEWGRGGRLAGMDVAVNDKAASPIKAGTLWAAGHYFPGYVGFRTLIGRAPSTTQGAVAGHSNVGQSTVSWFGPENGSTSTDPSGAYQVGGLQAGTYTFIATEPGCTPDSRSVTVVAGVTKIQDFQVGCNRTGMLGRK